MFLALSKVLDLLAAPLTWALLFLAASAILRRRRPRLAAALPAAALAVLVTFSLEPVAERIEAAAERGVASTFRPDPPYDALILLAGLVDEDASRASGEVELTAAADRLVRAVEVLHAGAAREVLVSGGVVAPLPGDRPEAEQLRDLLVRAGIAADRIAVEPDSRNTRENALACARIVKARGWRRLALVTSAAHVPRALAAFRAAGLDPDVLPVDRRAGDGRGTSWLPRAGALAGSTFALRELAGRVAYRLAGYAAAP